MAKASVMMDCLAARVYVYVRNITPMLVINKHAENIAILSILKLYDLRIVKLYKDNA
jgi:hypothetical protein